MIEFDEKKVKVKGKLVKDEELGKVKVQFKSYNDLNKFVFRNMKKKNKKNKGEEVGGVNMEPPIYSN